MSRSIFDHHDECDVLMYDEGAHCTCPDDDAPRRDGYDAPVYGEEPSAHDGRLAGPALDW